MAKDYFNCTKKVRGMLGSLGYDGEMNYPAVHRWLIGLNYYVMPFPRPYWKWEVSVIGLGKPNKKDLKLNLFEFEKTMTSFDEALKVGVEYVINSLCEAEKTIAKHGIDSDYCNEIVERGREEGFDV